MSKPRFRICPTWLHPSCLANWAAAAGRLEPAEEPCRARPPGRGPGVSLHLRPCGPAAAQALAGGGLAGPPALLVLAQRLLQQALLPGRQGAGSLAFRLSWSWGQDSRAVAADRWSPRNLGVWRRGEKGEAG